MTARGDSGAALVDGSGHILGFAYSRSDASSPASYSTWIWAAAVLKKHELEVCA